MSSNWKPTDMLKDLRTRNDLLVILQRKIVNIERARDEEIGILNAIKLAIEEGRCSEAEKKLREAADLVEAKVKNLDSQLTDEGKAMLLKELCEGIARLTGEAARLRW